MNGLYSTDAVRAFDAAAIDSGIPGYELMTRAAAAALRELRARWPVARDLLVLCGAGNNGGDGYVLARLAKSAGLSPRVVALVGRERLKDDAARAADDCLAAGVPVLAHQPQELASRLGRSDLVVDALLGIGLNTNVREELARVIGAINESGRPVLAIDIPSGLCADTGAVRGVAVIADLTVTFIARKLGLWLHEGPRHAGTICFDSLSGSEKLSARRPRHALAPTYHEHMPGAAFVRIERTPRQRRAQERRVEQTRARRARAASAAGGGGSRDRTCRAKLGVGGGRRLCRTHGAQYRS
ncbi:MAG: NAD(P)H-hydrate epimerase [Gammaproteobacteria bacterium]